MEAPGEGETKKKKRLTGAHCAGTTLYVATPTMGNSLVFFALKKASALSPGSTRTSRCSGLNVQGSTSLVLPANVTRMRCADSTGTRRAAAPASTMASEESGASECRIGWPPQPVCWQSCARSRV